MRVTFFLLIVGLFMAYPILAQDESKLNALLTEADMLIARNNLPEALSKTREALSISSGYHPALQKEINILYLMKDEKESIKNVDEAIERYPEEAGYFYLRGIINNGRGKYSKALEDFTSAIELKPADILYRCYLGRGVSYFNLLEFDMALTDLTASIALNDTVAGAYYSRAMVSYEIKDYTSSIKDFTKVLNFSEGNAALYFNLGMAYYRNEEKEKACPNFNKACSLGNVNACRMSLMECAKAIPTTR